MPANVCGGGGGGGGCVSADVCGGGRVGGGGGCACALGSLTFHLFGENTKANDIAHAGVCPGCREFAAIAQARQSTLST